MRGAVKITKPVVLVGMMGAGKSTVGRALADRLAVPFADLDAAIERRAGRSIREIFAGDGEAAFRVIEGQTLAALLDGAPRVIAAGGGAFAEAGVRALLAGAALSVWLKGDAALLFARAARAGGRPLLGSEQDFAALLKARERFYAEADVTVEIAAEAPAQTVQRIVDALAR